MGMEDVGGGRGVITGQAVYKIYDLSNYIIFLKIFCQLFYFTKFFAMLKLKLQNNRLYCIKKQHH